MNRRKCLPLVRVASLSCLFVASAPVCPADDAATRPENPSDAEILEKWTPGGDTNAPDLPYRHRYEAFERETDADWVDARWQQTDWGPFVTHSTQLTGQALRPKNLTLFLNRAKSVAAMFDLEQCGVAAVVASAEFTIDPARFGLLRKPSLQGDIRLSAGANPLWEAREGHAPKVSYGGLRLHGWQTLLEYDVDGIAVAETLWLEKVDGTPVVLRQIEVGPTARELTYTLADGFSDGARIVLVGETSGADIETGRSVIRLRIPKRAETTIFTLAMRLEQNDSPADFADWAERFTPPERIGKLRQPGPRRWGEPLPSRITESAGANQPYVVDEVALPFDNQFGAMLFLSSIDFLADGTAAVSAAHGDVWLVRGLGDAQQSVTWQRFATGLYQPLGLKVIDGKVIVLGRDQLTRLHDLNDDGAADWYESFNHDLFVPGQDHAYAMRLETDPSGRFYFLKAGAPPDGSALYRLSRDGGLLQRIATGFRHPFGMGVSPQGDVTVADNEGNWIPSSKIDLVEPGGFYGFMGGESEPPPNVRPDPPLCYLPKVADNACGGQAWNTSNRWGNYHRGGMIHFSWGRDTMHAVLEQQVGDIRQAATVKYPGINFSSGPADAEFNPRDGQLYVVGMDGWQTAAVRDGCLSRVRYTGAAVTMPTDFRAHANGILLRFAVELNPQNATKLQHYRLSQWNYRWSAVYGSYHYSLAHPGRVGHDSVAIDSVELLPDGRSVFLHSRDLQRVDQLHVHMNLFDRNGRPIHHDLYATVKALAEPMSTGGDAPSDPYRAENLMAWCIVPFDAKQRGPEQRAAMLDRLGIGRVAYDWREQHIPEFDAELAAYRKHDIELVGFWAPVNTAHPLGEVHMQAILAALERNHVRTQLWVMLNETLLEGLSQKARIDRAAEILAPLAVRADEIGCVVGLYNHGGWFGDVDNQIEIIRRMEKQAIFNVGIIYNLHHGHDRVEDFPELLAQMRPYLYALNLNGMRVGGPKILPLGQGDDDLQLLQAIRDSGYGGPIGILDHREQLDSEAALRENLAGLENLRTRFQPMAVQAPSEGE